MKTIELLICFILFLSTIEINYNNFRIVRKLEDYSDLMSDDYTDEYDVSDDVSDDIDDSASDDSADISSDTTQDSNNTSIEPELNNMTNSSDKLTDNGTESNVSTSNKTDSNISQTDKDVLSEELQGLTPDNNETLSDMEVMPYIQEPKLILVGFGEYNRPKRQKQWILFKVYFKRILAGIIPKTLFIPLNINYMRRLRFLEESEANCNRITNDEEDDIQFNCTAPVDPNKQYFTVAMKNNDLKFGNGEPINYSLSSYANFTKNNIESQTTDSLGKKTIVLNNTSLEIENNKFILNGQLSEDIDDDSVRLYLREYSRGIYQVVICDVTNYGNKNYDFECTPDESVNVHLQGIFGNTIPSNKNIIINFAENKNDLVNINLNNNNNGYNGNNGNNQNNTNYFPRNHYHDDYFSRGAIIGIILGIAALVIALIIIIICCCRRKTSPPFVQETVVGIDPKSYNNMNINPYNFNNMNPNYYNNNNMNRPQQYQTYVVYQ